MNGEESQNLINTKFHNIFHFNYGLLDDKTYWISSSCNTLLRIDKFTLNVLLSLNSGIRMKDIAKKYNVEIEEIADIYNSLKQQGFVVEQNAGKIKHAEVEEDIDIAPFVLLLAIMTIGQLFYFTHVARTTLLNSAMEGIMIAAIAIGAIFFHELVHFFIFWKFTNIKPKMRVTLLKWIPMVYVDTNLAWKLPKNKRLLISVGGLLGDLSLNSLAIILVLGNPSLEYFVTPFLLTQYTRMAIVINPIFGGDGYWILSDLLHAVNMETKGLEELRKGRMNFFSLYGLVSLIFSALGLLGVGWFMFNILKNIIKFIPGLF